MMMIMTMNSINAGNYGKQLCSARNGSRKQYSCTLFGFEHGKGRIRAAFTNGLTGTGRRATLVFLYLGSPEQNIEILVMYF